MFSMRDQKSDDHLWNVLGHASQVEPSASFARNLVRSIRQAKMEPRDSGIDRIRDLIHHLFLSHYSRVSIAITACIAIALASVLIFRPLSLPDSDGTTHFSSSEIISDAFDPTSEMVAMAYLGQLMAVVDPGQLDDDSLSDLFF